MIVTPVGIEKTDLGDGDVIYSHVTQVKRHSLVTMVLWRELSTMSASNATHNSPFFIPTGTHHC